MNSFFQKIHEIYLPFILSFICLVTSASAQWVRVDSSGIPTCFTNDGEYIYAGFHGGN